MKKIGIATLVLVSVLVLVLFAVSVAPAMAAGSTTKLYETSTSDFDGEPATISLLSECDATANRVVFKLAPSTLYNFVTATSNTIGSDIIIPDGSTVNFSAYFDCGDRVNYAYATWKFYKLSDSAETLICQRGDNSSGGVQLPDGGTATLTGSCTATSNVTLNSTDKLKLVINVWAESIGGGPAPSKKATHYWDSSYESWVQYEYTTPSPTPPTPYVINGYVLYNDSTACNGPIVNVTNQASTTEKWQAETNASYNYYQLVLDSEDVSANDRLEFNARNTNATQFNTTDHTVTQTELNDGGLFNFNLTLHPEEEDNVVNNFTTADIPVNGTVTGTHEDTHASDNGYESIEEKATGGNPSSRISYLEHRWTIDVPNGTKNNVTFYLEAHRIDEKNEGDDFNFSYSTDNFTIHEEYLVTVNKTEDTNLSCKLPTNLNGTVYIRVIDIDRNVGNGNKDTIDIDCMFIRSVLGAPDEIPPSQVKNVTVNTVSSSQLNVSWTKSNELDLDHYNVYRNETSGFTHNKSNLVAETTTNYYLDTGLEPSTTYYYKATAVDKSGNEGNASDVASNTTEAELPPTPYVINGYVLYNDSTACNGPIVNVTNQDSTTEKWQAETNASYNYYQLVLDSSDVSADDTLEFDARNMNATHFNTTQHTVTPDEINNGGLFNFNLTLHPSAGVNDTAWEEETLKGTVIEGSYENTTASDGDYEVIEEESTGGKPNKRISSLEHNWTINVTDGSKVTFHLKAYRIDTDEEGDNFEFAYWNDSEYVTMVTVNTSTDFNYTYDLPTATSGTVYIRVMDTDQTTPGNYKKATIHVDHLYIRSEP